MQPELWDKKVDKKSSIDHSNPRQWPISSFIVFYSVCSVAGSPIRITQAGDSGSFSILKKTFEKPTTPQFLTSTYKIFWENFTQPNNKFMRSSYIYERPAYSAFILFKGQSLSILPQNTYLCMLSIL